VAQALTQGAVWAQMGTIGIGAVGEIIARIGQLRPDALFVDAPVSGSKGPAEPDSCSSGPPARPRRSPILGPAFAAIGRKTAWPGEAGQGGAMKLAVNAYMSVLIEGGPLDAPIADATLHKTQRADFAPEFPLE
jgi:3-hydroxyisobutyrate dehydrogenase